MYIFIYIHTYIQTYWYDIYEYCFWYLQKAGFWVSLQASNHFQKGRFAIPKFSSLVMAHKTRRWCSTIYAPKQDGRQKFIKSRCYGRLIVIFHVRDQCEFLVVYSSSNNQGSSGTNEIPSTWVDLEGLFTQNLLFLWRYQADWAFSGNASPSKKLESQFGDSVDFAILFAKVH